VVRDDRLESPSEDAFTARHELPSLEKSTGATSTQAKRGKKRRVKRFSFLGTGRALFFITLKNFALTICTLGIYRFWARARVRRYTFSQLSFAKHRFAFHGTGQEAFRGFIRLIGLSIAGTFIAGLLIGAIYGGLFVLLELSHATRQLIFSATLSVLYGVVGIVISTLVIVNGRRYLVSRTSYRGIFFTFDGTIPGYCRAVALSWLASMFTLGLAFPYVYAATQNWLMNHTQYGTETFRSEVSGSALLKTWLTLLALVFVSSLGGGALAYTAGVLSPDTVGRDIVFILAPIVALFCGACAFVIGGCWAEAQFQRHVASKTFFQNARFQSSVTTWGLLRLRSLNFLTLMVTLGLGQAFNTVRTMRYRAECLGMVGTINLDAIGQRVEIDDATEEGLLDGVDFVMG
jgi:uncharacterized membrane protein YjgN (DUF898 family)